MYVIYYVLTPPPHSAVCTRLTVLNTKLSFWDARVFPGDSPGKFQLSVCPCVHLSVFHSLSCLPSQVQSWSPTGHGTLLMGSQMEMRMISELDYRPC